MYSDIGGTQKDNHSKINGKLSVLAIEWPDLLKSTQKFNSFAKSAIKTNDSHPNAKPKIIYLSQ